MIEEQRKIIDLCDYFVLTHPYQTQRWGWGEGLIAFALLELDKYLKQERYFEYVKNYCLYHYEKGIVVNSSDTVCPCLASLLLYQKTQEDVYRKITALGVDYIKNSKKILEGIPNHFGFGASSKYPQSIWVDSLMMLSVFTSRYALEFKDEELLEYAANMPFIFSKYLQADNGLWHHSYWVNEKKAYPKGLYWGRGNGWIVQSFPLIYENCGLDLKDIYQKTINAMIKYQCLDGSFKTIINHLETYKETSVTALFASGIYKAIKLGMLDNSYQEYADKAYKYCLKHLVQNKKGTFLKGISRPTVPQIKAPYWYYLIMVKKSNFNYGIAALILGYISKGELYG